MLTVARPVRAAARLVRKSSTALSMRDLSWVYISFSAGMAAIPDIAITQSLKKGVTNVRLYSQGEHQVEERRSPPYASGEPIFRHSSPRFQSAWLIGPYLVLDADPTVSQQLRRQRQALLQQEEPVEQRARAQLKAPVSRQFFPFVSSERSRCPERGSR